MKGVEGDVQAAGEGRGMAAQSQQALVRGQASGKPRTHLDQCSCELLEASEPREAHLVLEQRMKQLRWVGSRGWTRAHGEGGVRGHKARVTRRGSQGAGHKARVTRRGLDSTMGAEAASARGRLLGACRLQSATCYLLPAVRL